MDRLTKRFTDGGAYCEEIIDVGIKGVNYPTYVGKAVDKLAEYENLEEQGKLLKLPCAMGDIIYEVSYENREFVIKEHIVKEFVYRKYCFPRIEIYCENENGFLACNSMGKLDECLFLTKSAAEQALKEVEANDE